MQLAVCHKSNVNVGLLLLYLIESCGNMPLVSISDIIDATNDGTRCLIEGERLLDAKMLVTVGSLGLSDDKMLRVWALCLQSSALAGTPHVVEASLNLGTIFNRVTKISCSCKAGNSEKCKHCIGLLMFLNRIDNESELEDLSCTDLAQQWGKLKKAALSEFEALPLTDFCHFTPPVPIYASGIPDVSDALASDFAKLIIQGAPKSELFLHSSGARAAASRRNCKPDILGAEVLAKRQTAGELTEVLLGMETSLCFKKLKDMTDVKVKTLSPELLGYYNENVVVSTQQSVMLASNTATQCEQGWDAARKVRITGTRVYPLSTYTRNKNPNWMEKMKKIFDSSFKGTPDTMHGLEHEPNARKAYSKKCNVKVVENGILVHNDLPWLGTSVDGVVVDNLGSPQRIIEIKCPVTGKIQTAAELPKSAECCDKSNKLKKKHKYHGQIQHAMLLLGLKECDFISYASVDDTYVSERVQYDDKFSFDMLKPLVDIYFDKTLPYLYEKYQDNEEVGEVQQVEEE